MDLGKEKPKVLLLFRPLPGEGNAVWTKAAKALGSFTNLEVRESSETFSGLPEEESLAYANLFVDYSLVDWEAMKNYAGPPILFLSPAPFSLEKNNQRELLGEKLRGKSCLCLSSYSTGDLARLLHLFIVPKRLAGVTPLLEKGSVILGEKIQGIGGIGSSLDRLSVYLTQMENFELKNRIADAHQVLSAILFEAFRLAKESESPFPTIDFQVGISAKKIVANLRFQKGKTNLDEISGLALDQKSLSWQQAWQFSDALIVTEHIMHREIEVMMLLNKLDRDPSSLFHTFIQKKLERSGKREALLCAPQDFSFQILSDIRLKSANLSLVKNGEEEFSGEIDLDTLPEAVADKLKTLEDTVAFSREKIKNTETVVKELSQKLSETKRELNERKSELVKVTKASQAQLEKSGRRISDLEKRLSANTGLPAVESAPAESHGSADAKPADNSERATVEQKRAAMLEQRHTQLNKELAAKEKEIVDLKASLLRARKEIEKGDGASAGARAQNNGSGDAGKIKELETREAALKQEVKKLLFKAENYDKNVKAIQAEFSEKTKLLEQKLQGAKAKEIELLKKVDELSHALKKAQKAA